MIKLITIPKDGKVTIPKEVRKEIGLTGEEQYVLVADEGNIIFKRIGNAYARQQMKELLDRISQRFKKAKITRKDVEKAIKDVRAGK